MGVKRAGAILGVGATALIFFMSSAGAAPSEAAARAGKYLVSKQGTDGSWGGSSATAAPADQVADGVVALVSAEVSGTPLTKAVTYVTNHGPADAGRPSAIARVVFAAIAAGRDPRSFGGVDYVRRLRNFYNPTTGNYDSSTDANSLAIQALAAANDPIPPEAVTALAGRQCDDGGFPRSSCLLGSDVTSTALALEAFVGAKVAAADPTFAKARAFVVAAQNNDGGFGSMKGDKTVASPTAAVLTAVTTMRESPTAAPWQKAGGNPLTALVSFQDASGGLKPDADAGTPDDLTTMRALPGLAERAVPVRPVAATPASTTSVPSATASTAVPTTIAPTPTTVRKRNASRAPSQQAAPAGSTPSTEVGLAAPAGRRDVNGGSFVRLLPFIATLFGAGGVGVFLRRRART